ncbi:MAG TPA: hypothetical protein V6C65_16530 [Allocoleopsis sp.]
MPIIDLGATIAIINDEVNGLPDLAKIGPITTELAFWLDATRKIEVMRGMQVSPQSVEETLLNPNLYQSVVRARLAAYLGYRPSYADISGNLTQIGKDKADLAHSILYEYDAANNNASRRPDQWTRADQAFLNVSFTVRTVKFLKLIKFATIEAERRDTLRRDILANGGNPDGDQETAIEWSNRRHMTMQKQKTGIAPATAQLVDFVQGERFAADPVETELVSTVLEALLPDKVTKVRQAWISVADMGNVAKNDLKVLIRYGMVDRRSLLGVNRGRPPTVVRVSAPGELVLADLAREHLI